KAGKANLQLVERDLSRIPSDELAQLRQLNEQFISLSPSKKEIGFISRAMRFEAEPDVRFFAIRAGAENKPIGFLVLDPWYESGRLQGYQLHQFRLGPTKVWGVFLSVVAMLVQLLCQEGFSRLSLGGGIGRAGSSEEVIPRSWLYDHCRDATFRFIDRFHPLTNLSRNKCEFAGTDLNRYLAAPHRLPLLPLVRLARANNIF
ncbi:MAG TPA: phosphatidylglycerol lysyltransferase domain-containing protein, partial [Hymenobacter sp.]